MWGQNTGYIHPMNRSNYQRQPVRCFFTANCSLGASEPLEDYLANDLAIIQKKSAFLD